MKLYVYNVFVVTKDTIKTGNKFVEEIQEFQMLINQSMPDPYLLAAKCALGMQLSVVVVVWVC